MKDWLDTATDWALVALVVMFVGSLFAVVLLIIEVWRWLT